MSCIPSLLSIPSLLPLRGALSKPFDLEAGGHNPELSSFGGSDKELLDEISAVQTQIAPHVEQFRISLRDHIVPKPIEYHAARTSAPMTSLQDIVTRYHQNSSTGLDNKTFTEAEEAIDMIRHAGVKLRQLTSKKSLDFATPIYQLGQDFLLKEWRGTTHADALIWQFATRDIPRRSTSKPFFEHRGQVGASRQLWPPTRRTMKKTRDWLTRKWTLTPWKHDLEFDECTISVSDLKRLNRDRALSMESLGPSGGLSEWDGRLVDAAIERSIGPSMSGFMRTLRSIGGPFTILHQNKDRNEIADASHFAIGGDTDDEESGQGQETGLLLHTLEERNRTLQNGGYHHDHRDDCYHGHDEPGDHSHLFDDL